MDLDPRLQRAFDCVELMDAVGDRRAGKLCVMSFAALLAGEGHTDRPGCASPLVRAFAVALNNHMPRDVRQRLKPFAPRIVGTNDGCEEDRAAVLRRALAVEILPRAAAPPWRAAGAFRRLWVGPRRGGLHRRIGRLLDEIGREDRRPGHEARLASAVGQLLALCALDAADIDEAEWYWNQAIGLLDRLCDVGGAERPVPAVRADRCLVWLEETETIGALPGTAAGRAAGA